MSPKERYAESLQAARRRLAVVLVEGLDSNGLHIAQQLIGLGVGTILLRDDEPVAAADSDYRRSDQGRPKAEAACRMLRPTRTRSAVLEAPEGSAVLGLDLHLIVTKGALELHRLRDAVQNDSAVLPVELSSEGFCIGPLLGERAQLCLDCLILHGLTESTVPKHPQPGREFQASASPGTMAALTGPLGAIAGGIAVHQAQLLVDGAASAVCSGALFADAATGSLGHLPVAAHPECRCLMRFTDPGPGAPRQRRGLGRASRRGVSLETAD